MVRAVAASQGCAVASVGGVVGVKNLVLDGGPSENSVFFVPIRFCSGTWCQRLCGLAGLRPVTAASPRRSFFWMDMQGT